MLWLWILCILILLAVLLCLTRVGVRAAMLEGTLTLDLKVGMIHIRLMPKKKTAEKKVEQHAQPEKDTKPSQKKAFPKPALEDIKDAVRTLMPPLKRALGRTRRGIRIHPLRLALTLGGREDPAAAAEQYGYLHTGVWTVMPQLEHLLDIPDPRLHIGLDFDAAETVVEGEAGISIRVGTILAVGFIVAVPALKWFLRYRKKYKQQPPAPKTGPAQA